MSNEIYANPEKIKIEQDTVKNLKVEENIHVPDAVKILQSLYEEADDLRKGVDAKDDPEKGEIEQDIAKTPKVEENVHVSEAVKILQSLYEEVDDLVKGADAKDDSEKEIETLTREYNDGYEDSGDGVNNEGFESPNEEPDGSDTDEIGEASTDESVDDKEANEQKKELTEDKINELQQKAIQEAFEKIAKGEKLTDAEKGNLGEMLMDQYYIKQGYKPIHSPRVTDLQHKSGQGIDGVYEKVNPDGSKSYIIADAKVNHSQLNKGLADGTDQMSDAWVEKRLDDAVGKEKADEIRDAYEDDPESIKKEVYHFSYNENGENTGVSDVSSVDKDGNREGSRVLVQTFDAEGNATYESDTSEDNHEG